MSRAAAKARDWKRVSSNAFNAEVNTAATGLKDSERQRRADST